MWGVDDERYEWARLLLVLAAWISISIFLLTPRIFHLTRGTYKSIPHRPSIQAPDRFDGAVSTRLTLNDDAWSALDALQAKIDRLRSQVNARGHFEVFIG